MRAIFIAVAALTAALAAPGANAAPSAARQTELVYLLRHDCGSCHGMRLSCGLGPALTPGALAGKPDALLEDVILNGRSGTPMPPWRALLPAEDVRWLIGILRSGVARED